VPSVTDTVLVCPSRTIVIWTSSPGALSSSARARSVSVAMARSPTLVTMSPPSRQVCSWNVERFEAEAGGVGQPSDDDADALRADAQLRAVGRGDHDLPLVEVGDEGVQVQGDPELLGAAREQAGDVRLQLVAESERRFILAVRFGPMPAQQAAEFLQGSDEVRICVAPALIASVGALSSFAAQVGQQGEATADDGAAQGGAGSDQISRFARTHEPMLTGVPVRRPVPRSGPGRPGGWCGCRLRRCGRGPGPRSGRRHGRWRAGARW